MLDLGSKQVVARIPVLGKPAGIAMARDGRTAYVTSTEGKYVSVIDTASRNIVSKIAIPDTPLGIAADPAGRFIYVAGFYQPRLYKIDLATGTIAASVEVGASPSGVALTPDGALVVTTDRDDNQISIIDAKTFARKGTVKVGAHPFGVTIDPQGARAYTANVESNDVSVIDLKGAKLLGSVAVGKRPYAVALAKGRGFSTDQYGGTVSVFDLATLQPVKRISVGDYPEGINQRRRQQCLRRQLVLERRLDDQYRDAGGDRENARRRRPPRIRNFFARNAVNFPGRVISDLDCVSPVASFWMLGDVAEFEWELIRTRTGEGRARAVANGVRLGRKPTLTYHQQREAIKRRDHCEACTMISDVEMSELPVDPELAFVQFEKILRGRVQEMETQEADSQRFDADSYRLEYMNKVHAAAKVFGIEALANLDVPRADRNSSIAEQYRQFVSGVDYVTIQIRLHSARSNRQGSGWMIRPEQRYTTSLSRFGRPSANPNFPMTNETRFTTS